jgi:c-di-GMP-related signal transduction protein
MPQTFYPARFDALVLKIEKANKKFKQFCQDGFELFQGRTKDAVEHLERQFEKAGVAEFSTL